MSPILWMEGILLHLIFVHLACMGITGKQVDLTVIVGDSFSSVYWLSPLAILLSFPSVPSFRIYQQLWSTFCSFPSYWIGLTVLMLAAVLGQQSKSSTKFVAFAVLLQLQNTDSTASIGGHLQSLDCTSRLGWWTDKKNIFYAFWWDAHACRVPPKQPYSWTDWFG